MTIKYRKIYPFQALIGILFVLVYTEVGRREVLFERLNLLYELLLINYLYTTIMAFAIPFVLGFDMHKNYKKEKKISFFDVLVYLFGLVQIFIFLFVRDFDWAFD